MNNNFVLLRMILIDSYSQGHAVEIKLNGHTTLNGRNAAGKTTLLRLLPIFLGESPSRIIRSSASTENFSKHYFPTMASYVIYEYQRRDQKALAVIHGDGQREGVSYRFVDSGYDDNLFYENGSVIQSNDLYRHLNKIGVSCTKELSLSNYRQILQNNSASKEYRQLATRYSFVGSGARLNHLERVISGILQRVTTFDDLRRMVISSVQDEDKQFALSTGRAELRKWVEEFQSHQALMEKSQVMEQLEQSELRRNSMVVQLSDLHTKFITLRKFQEQQKLDAETNLENAKLEKSEAEQDYAEKLQKLNDAKSEHASKAKSAQNQVDDIDQRYKRYQQEKIEEKCAQVDSIPNLKEKASRLKLQHSQLIGEFSDVNDVFEKLKSEEHRVAQSERSKLEESKSAAWQEHQVRQEGLQVSHQLSITTVTEAQKLEITALQTKQSEMARQVAVHEERVKNIMGDPELLILLEQAQIELTKQAEIINKANEDARVAERELASARKKFEDGEKQLTESSNALESAESTLVRLCALQSAGDDTLLGFMRTNKPEWAASIGRVINEDLLLRKDLAPDVAEGDSLYGLSINLEKIDAGRMENEEVFNREFNRIEERVKQAQIAVEEDEATLQVLSEKRKNAQQFSNQKDFGLSECLSVKKTIEARLRSLRNQYEASRISALEIANAALQHYKTEVEKINVELIELQKQHKKSLQAMKSELEESLKQEKARHEHILLKINQQQELVNQNLIESIKNLDEELNASLVKKGIDPKLLKRLGDDINQASQEVEVAESEVSVVSQYRAWLESVWPSRDILKAEVAEFSNNVQTISVAIDALLKERHQVYKSINEIISAKEKESLQAASYVRYINTHIESLSAYEPATGAELMSYDRANTLQSLADQKASAIESLKKELVEIATGVEDIRRVMVSRPNTRPEQYHSTSIKERGSPTPGREFEWLDVIRGWFNSEHLVHRTSLLQLAKTMAMNISAFWTGLNDFKKRVASFERELRSSLDQGALFDRISEVDVQIATELDKQDYWEVIERLHMEYETWHAQGESSLPPQGFVNAATEVASILNDDKGLVANPIDLLRIKIVASVNGRHVTATNENELETMSSTGLSYIVLCVVLVGFVNRIRGKQQITIPWPVDELRDLDFDNARTLIELLSRNNISLIAAFPDVDTDLATLFDRNYKILDGRKVAIIKLEETNDEQEYLELAHV